MTRSTILRLLLAIGMLRTSVTAYYWLLPRRTKWGRFLDQRAWMYAMVNRAFRTPQYAQAILDLAISKRRVFGYAVSGDHIKIRVPQRCSQVVEN